MNILITGGTGFIGTELRTRFLRQGHYLTIITRSPEKYESEAAENQSFINWKADLVSAMEQVDVVINLVGENIFGKFWTDEVKERLYSSRVHTTRQLSEAISKADSKPSLFISASAVSYYGDRKDDILDENQPAGDDFLARLCVDWEAAARPVEEEGVRLVIFRNGIVLGKGGGASQYMLPVFKLGLGGATGDGTQYFPWIHLLDVCRATEFAIQNEEVFGAYNLTAPNPVTMNELADTLGDVLNRPSFFRVPGFILKRVLGKAATPLLVSLRVLPERLEKESFRFRFDHLKEALADIV